MNYIQDSTYRDAYTYNNQYPQQNPYAPWQHSQGHMNKCGENITYNCG